MKEYIHYGSGHFDRSHFFPVKNSTVVPCKPHYNTCFWASPIGAKLGWFDWCIREDFFIDNLNTKFKFTISPNARILYITKMEDLSIDEVELREIPPCKIDYEALSKKYDAVEVNLSDGNAELYFSLYGWDCDSIVIMNPDIIQEVA